MNFGLVQNFLATLVKGQRLLGTDEYSPLEELLEKLMSSSGEISAMVTAREILDRYKKLDAEERLKFFQLLESEFNAEPDQIRLAYRAYEENPGSQALQELNDACEPRRRELFRRLNQTAGATHDLVAMRTDLLQLIRQQPKLAAVDSDFVHLFSSWFARGFLMMHRIDWQTPADILERIIRYEAVHEIQDWDDLRRRIQPENRRCFAFFHPALIDEPLIFVEVALSNKIPGSIGEILKSESEEELDGDYDTATFYSISNCQPGLRNISFGNFLIKQVVQELQSEVPSIKNFVTLSPIPGFCRWLANEDSGIPEHLEHLAKKINSLPNTVGNAEPPAETLKQLCAEYLLNAKRGILPLDPVARFHLGNGARIHRILIAADTSGKGLQQSRGMMVNYLYDPRYIERNHEQFMTDGIIDSSSEVQKPLNKTRPPTRKKANGS
ncbi:MAG: malonyl-CoA decarboxylase [Gammaproteobacteria bacterium]|nr:malonyl-CoA decarboxylase [Pseudomonadales bacterium]MCP5346781.1 malonyl-CoA decarboxylase [Pseudomonadales bacterium]